MTDNIETVHLAIDIQDNFCHVPYWTDDDFDAFETNVLELINGCKELSIPTLQIIHVEKSGVWAKTSGHNIPMSFMPTDLNGTFEKGVHNALTDSGLAPWLKAHNVRNIIISGLRTEQCCETTTRVASDFGYHVDFITDATHTFPMTHLATGQIHSTSEIKLRTEMVLQNRFAEIHSVKSVLTKYRK